MAVRQPSVAISHVSSIQRHPLAVFFVATILAGWLFSAVASLLLSNPIILPLVALPISYAPAVMAWIMLRVAGTPDERRLARQRLLNLPVDWHWLIVAVLILPAMHTISILLGALFGGRVPFHPLMLILLPAYLLTNLGEEISWRGYALPKLQSRHSPLASGLIVGVMWALFHVVAMAQNKQDTLVYVVVGSVVLIDMSVITAWLFNRTNSVPLTTLTHAMYDVVAIAVMPLIETGSPLTALALGTAVDTIPALGVAIATHGRLGKHG